MSISRIIGPLPERAYAIARSPAARTARTSMPSTCSPGIANDRPRWHKCVVEEERSIEVPIAYLLFSMTKTIGQLPQLGHVEGLVDLALVGRAVAEVAQAHVVVAAVLVGEGEAGAQRHACADDAVAAVEVLLGREHVHGAALALGAAAAPAGQLGHDALGVHADG